MICATLIALTLDANAINIRRNTSRDSSIVAHYVDSLNTFRARQDTSTATYKNKLGIEYNSLFMPTTFFKHVAHNALSLDGNSSELDKTYMQLYLQHPEMISTTESELAKTGKTITPSTVKVKHAPEIIDNVAPQPIEPVNENIDIVVHKPNFWTIAGDYDLQFLQNYVSSNWYQGGESNYSMISSITISANYNNKQKVKWDNKLDMKLGFQTSRQDSLHSFKASENLIRLTSKLGIQATKKWYYTLQAVATTQFMRQWQSNSEIVTTDS